MNTKETRLELKTSSKKTVEFYNRNKNIDFVEVNDMIVDFLEKLVTNLNGEMTNTITKELLERIKTIGGEVTTMRESVDKSNKEIINNILLKMYEQKTGFINDIKILIDKSDNDNLLKLIDKMEKDQSKIINEIIPKSNTEYYQKYESLLRVFKDELKNTNQINIIEQKHMEIIKHIESSLMNHVYKSEERLQNNINEIKTINILNSEIQKDTNTNLNSYLNKFKNSSLKGQIAENNIEEILGSIYKSAEIVMKSKEAHSGDIILKRTNMEPILFEIKNFKINVPIIDIEKFIRDVNENNMPGIMLSISSGISNKKNFQIDITKNNNICIYIHNMEYDVEKVRLAVDIIDNLSSKIKENNKNFTITSDIIEQINNDYQTFLLKRDLAVNHIKESTKKTIQYIEEMELKNLNNYLSSKFSFKNSSTLKCTNCNNFIGTNLKSLATHKRKCKGLKQNNNTTLCDKNEDYDETITSNDDLTDSIKNSDESTKNKVFEIIEEFKKKSSDEEPKNKPNKKPINKKLKSKEIDV